MFVVVMWYPPQLANLGMCFAHLHHRLQNGRGPYWLSRHSLPVDRCKPKRYPKGLGELLIRWRAFHWRNLRMLFARWCMDRRSPKVQGEQNRNPPFRLRLSRLLRKQKA